MAEATNPGALNIASPSEKSSLNDPPSQLAAWLGKAAVPLTTDPHDSIDDFEPLRPSLERARLVALGEATHGMSESFRLKHRFVRFLVTRMGFTALAIEGLPADTMRLNEYVQTGRGDPEKALFAVYGGFTWDVVEMLEFVEWLRKHNDGAERKVGIHGFDCFGPAAVAVGRYLLHFAPDLSPHVAEALTPLSTQPRIQLFQELEEEKKTRTGAAVSDLVRLITEERAILSARSGPEAWRSARSLAELVYLQATVPSLHFRDAVMAAQARFLLGLEGPGGKLVCWAHNGHVLRGSRAASLRSTKPPLPHLSGPAAGKHLGDWLGDEYLVVGETFDHGSVRAIDGAHGGIHEFEIPPAPLGSLDGALSQHPDSCFAVDLRLAPEDVAEWLSSEMPMHRVQGMLTDSFSPWDACRPAVEYDLIVFVREATAATGIRAGERNFMFPETVSPQERLPSPTNLAFMDRHSDGRPTGWWVSLGSGPLGGGPPAYRLSFSEAQEGRMRIERLKDWWVGGMARIEQCFEANQFRGQTLTVRVWASTSAEGIGNEAELFVQLWGEPYLCVYPSTLRTPHPLASATELISPLEGYREIRVFVPDEAQFVVIGFRLAGSGTAEIGPFEVR